MEYWVSLEGAQKSSRSLGERCSEAGIRSGEGESLVVGRDLCWEARSPTVFANNNTASQKGALEAGEAGGLRTGLAQERRAGSHRSFSGARGGFTILKSWRPARKSPGKENGSGPSERVWSYGPPIIPRP